MSFWIPLVSSIPLSGPALCWLTSCECAFVCDRFGAPACIVLASLVFVVLFVAIGLLEELRLLASLK